ncbi:MAG: hypothetical protein ABIT05_00535 [Chitinophagaceae bacterium]
MKKVAVFAKTFVQGKKTLTVLLLWGILSGIYSCNNNKGSGQLTGKDSMAIAKHILAEKIEKIYLLKLSIAMQQTIFTTNDVKQIHFKWHSYPDNTWGLDAYGMDSTGKTMLTGPFTLEPLTTMPLVTNYQYLDRIELMVWQRGDLKSLLNLTTLHQNLPVETGEYKDLLFTPTQYPYPDTENSMYFEVTLFPNIVQSDGKIKVAGTQGYINPSPPARPGCTGSCDDISL